MTRAEGRPLYGLAIGLVVGMLVAGLAFPLTLGRRLATESEGASALTPGAEVAQDAAGGVIADGAPVAGSPSTSGPTRSSGSPAAAAAPGGGATSPESPAGVTLTASDRGVTKDKIKVGAVITDPGGLEAVGISLAGFPPEREERAYRAFFDDINRRGGILGRKIEPVFRVVDFLSEEDYEAACREMTQDHKVFAVFNFYGAPPLCYTKSSRTPLFRGDSATKGEFDASKGYLSTPVQSSLRMTQNLAWELHRMGVVKGKKIGILASSGPGSASGDMGKADAEAMIKIFRDLKHDIAHVSWLSEAYDTAQSQIPGEVVEMKRKGVQVVAFLTELTKNTNFAQNAEAQQFYPQYAANDWGGNGTDTAAQGMPRSYDGAIIITSMRDGEWRTGLPEGKADRACLDVYEKASGEKIPHSADDSRYAVGLVCDGVYRFAESATRAGADLTRDRLMSAFQTIGVRDIPFTGGGSYGPGKFDGADYVRTKRFKSDCTCHVVTEDFRRGKY